MSAYDEWRQMMELLRPQKEPDISTLRDRDYIAARLDQGFMPGKFGDGVQQPFDYPQVDWKNHADYANRNLYRDMNRFRNEMNDSPDRTSFVEPKPDFDTLWNLAAERGIKNYGYEPMDNQAPPLDRTMERRYDIAMMNGGEPQRYDWGKSARGRMGIYNIGGQTGNALNNLTDRERDRMENRALQSFADDVANKYR